MLFHTFKLLSLNVLVYIQLETGETKIIRNDECPFILILEESLSNFYSDINLHDIILWDVSRVKCIQALSRLTHKEPKSFP